MHSLSWKLKKILKMVSPEEGKTLLNNFASLPVVQAITYILPYLFRVIGPGNT